jgi:hypothetical protein
MLHLAHEYQLARSHFSNSIYEKFKSILVSSSQKQNRKSIQAIQNFIAYLSAINSHKKSWDYFSAAIMDMQHGGTQWSI